MFWTDKKYAIFPLECTFWRNFRGPYLPNRSFYLKTDWTLVKKPTLIYLYTNLQANLGQ